MLHTSTSQTRKTTVTNLISWFGQNARDLPWRRTNDPYAIWVSEIMLQQTQVKTVLPYWERWMRTLPTLEALARAKQRTIHKLWEGLGYYTRVRNMHRAAQIIRDQHGGQFPQDYDAVLALPGIGRYTAGAICSIAFNQPKPILDGNVIRVLTRLFGITENPREKATNAVLWSISDDFVHSAATLHAPRSTLPRHRPCSQLNQALMELGALICTPRQPLCRECPIMNNCAAHRRGLVEQLPARAATPHVTQRRFIAFVIENRGRFFVRQRPSGVVNAHLWEFPNIELNGTRTTLETAARNFLGKRQVKLTPLCTIRHSITRYRISLQAFKLEVDPEGNHLAQLNRGRWLKPKALSNLPFTSAHKKVLEGILTDNRDPLINKRTPTPAPS